MSALEPSAPPTERDDDLLTRAEASEHLRRFGVRLKPASLARAWSTGANGPARRHVRGKARYPRQALRAWVLAQTTELRSSSRASASAGRQGAGAAT